MSRGARDSTAVAGNISSSMRENYAGGVAEYYTKVGSSYRNPHLPGVKACVYRWMNEWWEHEQHDDNHCRILDMACGGNSLCLLLHNMSNSVSGEVTLCAREWETLAKSAPSSEPLPRPGRRLRVCPIPLAFSLDITATDPYTSEAFQSRTGGACLSLSFEDIANGGLPGDDVFDMVFVSFALHLVPDASGLFALLWALSIRTRWLIVIAPHKKPEIKGGWGWIRWDSSGWKDCSDGHVPDTVLERVHLRVYRSVNVQ